MDLVHIVIGESDPGTKTTSKSVVDKTNKWDWMSHYKETGKNGEDKEGYTVTGVEDNDRILTERTDGWNLSKKETCVKMIKKEVQDTGSWRLSSGRTKGRDWTPW